MKDQVPSGFVLSDAAMYAFQDQDVYPDLLSFAAAIPDHLKPLFLIPIAIQVASKLESKFDIAARIAELTGETDASDLFSYQTFVNHDNEPAVPSDEEGSIYDYLKSPEDSPVAQPQDQFCGDAPRYDARVVPPFDTSYYDDGSSVDLFDEGYPYRTDHEVRHSSTRIASPVRVKIALKPEVLQEHAPDKTKDRAKACSVKFVSYMKPNRMYTFSVNCGNTPHTVRAVVTEVDEITMACDCPFWRWNGPEYHAKAQNYMLGKPRGTAAPPDIRDPDREHWLCKHAYAVLRRLENHIQDVVDDHWELDDHDIMGAIDAEWDRLSEEVETPLEEIGAEDPDVEEPQMEVFQVSPEKLDELADDLDGSEDGEEAEVEPETEVETQPEDEEEFEDEPELILPDEDDVEEELGKKP